MSHIKLGVSSICTPIAPSYTPYTSTRQKTVYNLLTGCVYGCEPTTYGKLIMVIFTKYNELLPWLVECDGPQGLINSRVGGGVPFSDSSPIKWVR